MNYEVFILELSKFRKIISGNNIEIHNRLPSRISYGIFTNAINGRNKNPETLKIIFDECKLFAKEIITESQLVQQ